MKIQKTAPESLPISDSAKFYGGYTVFTPIQSKTAYLIDMRGNVVHRWEMPYPPALYGVLLPNGNLLYASKKGKSPLSDFEGAGGILIEVDWDSNVVWQYEDKSMHHAFYRKPNGNTVILKWVPVPDDIAIRVKGGMPGTEKDGVMWGDCFQEITRTGKVAWEWLAHEHLDPEVDVICPLCPRDRWTHANACTVMPNADILTSFLSTNTIAIIERDTGEVLWRWGTGEIAHQNDPTFLENGNVLLFDNGIHTESYPMGFSRILEVNPKTSQMVWAYEDKPPSNFFSSVMGSCQRLPNGNTLICEATTGRIFEINPDRMIVWEFVNPAYQNSSVYGRNNYIARAYRYGIDYEGLGKIQIGEMESLEEKEEVIKEEKRPSTARADEKKVSSRLEHLGY